MQSALFIGRFQPFHQGHLYVVKEILKSNERVIIAIGSAEKNYIRSNPLTAGERFQLIDEALKEAEIPAEKYCIIPIRNINNYALWVHHVNQYVPPYTRLYTGSEIVKACYDGQYYNNHRENVEHKPEIVQIGREFDISATKVRDAILEDQGWEKMVPPAVAKLLKTWNISKRLQDIKDTMDVTKYNHGC